MTQKYANMGTIGVPTTKTVKAGISELRAKQKELLRLAGRDTELWSGELLLEGLGISVDEANTRLEAYFAKGGDGRKQIDAIEAKLNKIQTLARGK